MQNFKLDRTNPSYSGYIQNLFDITENGKLTITGINYGFTDPEIYNLEMTWTEKDVEVFTKDFEEHYKNIEKVAVINKESKDKDNTNYSAALKPFIEAYIKNFAAASEERFEILSAPFVDEEEFTDDDREYLDKKYKEIYKEAADRLGVSYAYEVIMSSRRLCKLMEIGAPSTILTNETRMLINAMIMSRYSTHLEAIPERNYSEDQLKEIEHKQGLYYE